MAVCQTVALPTTGGVTRHVGKAKMRAKEAELQRIVRSGLLRSRFHPVKDLVTGGIVAYEIRHTAVDSELRASDDIRATLRGSEYVGDLDASLRFFGMNDASRFDLTAGTRLFLNAEPESFVTLEDRTGEPPKSIVLQLEASRMVDAPASMLRSIRLARMMGWEIGVTQVGRDLASCAFLPVINPAVISLHPDILRSTPRHRAQIASLIHAHCERTHASILATGIDSECDLQTALALGARFGTGSYVAEPTDHPRPLDTPHEDALAAHFSRNEPLHVAPHTVAYGHDLEPIPMPQDMTYEMFRSLQERARRSGEATIVLASLGEQEMVKGSVAEAIAELAETTAMTVVLSGGFDQSPIPGTRGGRLDEADPIRNELSLVVVGPDWAGMVTARPRANPGQRGERIYDLISTSSRLATVDAARSLLSRVPSQRSEMSGTAA